MLPRMTNETTEQNKCSHELAGPHREALVTRQAGEASEKYSTWWNLKHSGGTSMFIDLDKTDDWQQTTNEITNN